MQHLPRIAMPTVRIVSIIVGILYISGMIIGMLSTVPAIDDPVYMSKMAINKNQMIGGAIYQFCLALIYIFIAIFLYPIVKDSNPTLSIGYLSFRIIAGIFNILGVLLILLLFSLSQEYISSGIISEVAYQLQGSTLRNARDIINHVLMIISLGISSVFLYTILYQTELIPQWLSFWGLIGIIVSILASMLVMLQKIEIITPIYFLLNLPLALQELIFALLLIIRGLKKTI
jgi:hypothetical protein